jgi:predicted XRE-type DNA-binding protein
MQQDSLQEALRAYLKQQRITQAQLANRIGISQATVSRAMKQTPIRQTQQGHRLFNFMQEVGMIGRPPPLVEQLVLGAFVEVWDRSEAHADAVARIIKATEGLRPVKRETA